MDAEAAANQIARHQHGLITARQATIDAGLNRGTIARRRAQGRWERLGPGIYLVSAVPRTWRTDLLAVCLRHGALASHRTAAVLWGLDGVNLGRPEVIVPKAHWFRHRVVTVHESTQFHLAEPTIREGIPTTEPGRTLLDLAGVVPFGVLEIAVDDALRRRLTDWSDLFDVLLRHARRGRNGSAAFRALLDVRMGDDQLPLSGWSRLVATLLIEAGLPAPDLEHRILDHHGNLLAQVDLAYTEKRLAIELDSVRYHLNRVSFERDPRRRNALIAIGWTVLTFTWDDYRNRSAALTTTVQRVYRSLLAVARRPPG